MCMSCNKKAASSGSKKVYAPQVAAKKFIGSPSQFGTPKVRVSFSKGR